MQSITLSNTIINDNFLLYSEEARELYHNYAKSEPIIDYHSHLSDKDLAFNKPFKSLTQIWLAEDHYKWRAMRANGIDEKYISGDVSDKERFLHWAKTVPKTLRNPLFHWTHLELKRYFGIDEYLNLDSAEYIYNTCNEMLQTPEFLPQRFPEMMNVKVICTTDDPTDNLTYHQQLASSSYKVKVLPTFRPDNCLKIEDTNFFPSYIKQLGEVADIDISTPKDLIKALRKRAEFFHSVGCRLSDHGMKYLHSMDFTEVAVNKAFEEALEGKNVSTESAEQYKSYLLYELGKIYHSLGWVQQFHVNVIRNNSRRLFRTVGADCGTDSMADFLQAEHLARFFDRLDNEEALTKTIIYNLNPADNELFATMLGNFQDGKIAGKMQYGSGWWFLDQKDGMEKQINTLSNMGLLSHFVGMLTDSRSLLSFPRHEYFRRTLCNLLGADMAKGELPNDVEWIGSMVKDICYSNAKNYFGF